MNRAIALITLAASLSLGGCAVPGLSDAVTSVTNEVADAQNRQLLLNIVRRSQGHPVHFAELDIVRDRNRANVGADLSFSTAGDTGRHLGFYPFFELEQRPQFEIAPLDNEEFYRALLAPVPVSTIKYFLQQDSLRQLILFLVIDKLRVRMPGGDSMLVNDPRQPAAFTAFQRTLEEMIDQGLTAEDIRVMREVGPALLSGAAPDVADLISAKKEGLVVEEIGRGEIPGKDDKRTFRMREIVQTARFCFAAPRTPLARAARCESTNGRRPSRRYSADDPKLFSYAQIEGAVALFDAGELGTMEIHTRSLDQIVRYVGELAWVAANSVNEVPAVKTRGRRQKLIVLETGPRPLPSLVAVDYQGKRYSIPAGPEGELSGEVLAFLSQLLDNARSIGDRPLSRSVTLIGD